MSELVNVRERKTFEVWLRENRCTTDNVGIAPGTKNNLFLVLKKGNVEVTRTALTTDLQAKVTKLKYLPTDNLQFGVLEFDDDTELPCVFEMKPAQVLYTCEPPKEQE